MTRASFALLRLDLQTAASLHPLVFVVLPVLAIGASAGAIAYVRTGRASPPDRVARALGVVLPLLLVALLAVWIARFFGHLGGPAPV